MTAGEFPLQDLADALQVASVTIDRSQQELAACRAALAQAIDLLRAFAAQARPKKGGEVVPRPARRSRPGGLLKR